MPSMCEAMGAILHTEKEGGEVARARKQQQNKDHTLENTQLPY